jgi:hypothetical protein
MTIKQRKVWETCWCCTTDSQKYSSLIEIVVPGVDGILYCKALMPPDDEFHDMRAMMHEKQLTSVSLEALYDAVPVCKPTITSVIVEKKNGLSRSSPTKGFSRRLRPTTHCRTSIGIGCTTWPNTTSNATETSYTGGGKGGA